MTARKHNPNNEPDDLPTTSEDAAREAREQADAYDSLFAPQPLELDDGGVVMVPPHPDYGMLDDDRMEDWDELMFAVDTEYDREPDIFIPEQHVKGPDGNDTGIVMPAETRRGGLLRPFRTKGKLVKPSHSVKVVIACLGEVEYKRLRAGGRCAADVWKIWADTSDKIKGRQASDPKSEGSTVAVAPVPASDS